MNIEKGYTGLAAAIILHALRDYCCTKTRCARHSNVPALQNAICVSCRREAETFLYTDWCKYLLDALNIDRSTLYRALDADALATHFNHRGRPALDRGRGRHPRESGDVDKLQST